MTANKRKEAESAIYTLLEELTGDDYSSKVYRNLFKGYDDETFAQYMQDLKAGSRVLTVFSAPYSDQRLSLKRTLRIAKKYGYDLTGPLEVEDPTLGMTYTTKPKLAIYTPTRRLAQVGSTKISVSEDDRKRDKLTQQVIADSQASAISLSEFMILSSSGLEDALLELFVARGGDSGALDALSGLLMTQGSASLAEVNKYSTGVGSTRTMYTFMRGMHLISNL